MSNPEPTIRVRVDASNPGQFFACCGLLELADRLWPGAEGWFEGGEFRIACEGTMRLLLAVLVMDPPEEVKLLAEGVSVQPLLAPLRFSFDGGCTTALTLDAWVRVGIVKGEAVAVANPPWNFWSGQQTPMRIWQPLRLAVASQLASFADGQLRELFRQRAPLGGRFGFDPGPAWNALDVGFSPNEQKLEVGASAAVELLAAVGIQRFRPVMAKDRQSFVYATWESPLAPTVAAAAAAGLVRSGPSRRYRGRVVGRGSYGALGHSTLLRGGDDE
jgi:CRISPR-associated protein Csx14